MGQEITSTHFNKQDFTRFAERLAIESALLKSWFEEGRFAQCAPIIGAEIEAWLVDQHCRPAPINREYLAALADPMVVPELASFNIELNTTPLALSGDVFGAMAREVTARLDRCVVQARKMGIEIMTMGILPTVREQDLSLKHISGMTRYHALNEQILRLRKGAPFHLDITGHEALELDHEDVMLEAATTSFQIHTQVAPEQAVRFYNASIIASAATVAVSANSPFLFGHALWDETRIPLFEQAVSVRAQGTKWPDRVSFGMGYAIDSLYEVFAHNLEHFPVVLPEMMDTAMDEMAHVRLHNGTLWRWNRPLIGIDETGQPHLRIEHRVIPSGPTVRDMIANMAFYLGLSHALASDATAPESKLSFDVARHNFYQAARAGLNASIEWCDGKTHTTQSLIVDKLVPLARAGLVALNVDEGGIDEYLGIIETRARLWCNGAAWQRAYVAQHGVDMAALARRYQALSMTGKPVHTWPV